MKVSETGSSLKKAAPLPMLPLTTGSSSGEGAFTGSGSVIPTGMFILCRAPALLLLLLYARTSRRPRESGRRYSLYAWQKKPTEIIS